ncbi:hypothetical protein F4803DRAFT_25474 [Xylaria telfairii]|nr:hypothetical protein F4803DRAFT_25474 [Xylaria telfairii]
MREAIAGLVKDPESGIRGALQGYEKAWDPKQGINYESEASLGDIPRVDIMGGKIGMQSERMFHDSAIGSSITQESTKQVAGPDVEALSEGMPTVDEVNEELECATVYTQTSNDSTGQVVQNYEKNLVDRLCHDLSLRTANEADVARVSNSLPHVLQVFAFKIAKEGKGRNYRSTMRFMLKHRRSIANQLASKARESSETSDSVERQENPYTRSPSPGMSYEDKVRGWHPTHSMHDPNMPLEPEETKPEPSLADEVRNKENQESELKDVFSELVADSRAYEWLLARLRGELTQVIPAEATRPRLSEAILRELHGAAIFSRTSTPRCIDVLFNVEWSPHSFFKEQEYGVPPEEAVVKALVLVGTTTQSEGLACGEYLLRQWPESAPTFIRLVQSVVKSAEDTSHKEKLNDGTTLQAAAKDGRFMLEADGHPDTVIEIGEQLMWISCALRSSDFADVGTCEPSFGDILTTSRSPSKVVMRIELTNKLKHDKLNESQSGACWKDLFRSPLLVEGYPIPLRCTESALGLQLSLSTLMALVPDSRLVPYMGKLFIKRFATLLVAVKRLGDIILWHAISNKDGSYIYYHDERVRLHEIDVGSSLLREVDMGELKHVVGWTSNAENVAGTSSGNYRVLPSSLQPYRPLELEVERFTVGVSKYVVANSSIKLGLRDRPITMRAGEDEKGDIKHISKCFVVLYDVKDHRGFLLDGATALLHLVRTSIVDDQEDGLIDNLIDGRTVNDSIQLDNNSDIRRRAMKTLLNNENALLKLYEVSPKEEIKIESKTVCEVPNTPKTTTEEIDSQRKSWVRFKHRVTAIWWMLDQAINYSTDNTALKAKIKILEGKKVLEGYDFMDFALCGTSQAKLRSISPMSHSEGWLEAVRDLPAVTLFGRGFGDVIKHKVSTNAAHYMCSDWRDVPKGCGYLAMSSATLERVLEYGDPKAWKLQDPFQPCRSEDRNCDRRHFLVDDQNNTAQEDRMTFPKHGAVIVGHKRHKQSVLQAITHRIGRHVDSSYEISIASQTSVTQQPSWDTQFADMSQPTASSSSSAAAENKCIRENTTSDTVTDTSQNDVQRSTAMEAQRPSALLAVPIITHSKATTPSEVNTESGPSKRPRPVDLSRTDAITVNANNQAGPRISISSSRTQTEAGVVQPSTTPMVTTLSGASAKAEPSKRSQPATMINADNNHEVPQIPKSPSCNQNEGEVVQSSTATAAGPLPCAGQTLPNSTNSQIALQGQKRPIFYLFKTWAKKPRPWISKRRPS